jgi:hypothetical protein
LSSLWCNIIVLNILAPSEEKSDVSKDRSDEEIEQDFEHFPEYRRNIILRDFNAKVGKGNIFKPKIGKIVMIIVLE